MSRRVHVGIWYILRAQRGSHTPTLRPKYTPYSYMDPLGKRRGRDDGREQALLQKESWEYTIIIYLRDFTCNMVYTENSCTSRSALYTVETMVFQGNTVLHHFY